MEKRVPRKASKLIANLPWGAHGCHFYKSQKDLLDILLPYFKAGLSNNEFCMWVTAKPLRVEDAARRMRKFLPRFDAYLEKGQIEIIPHTDWYVKGGAFNGRRVLAGWLEKYEQASARGFDGLRLTGDSLWLKRTTWKKFADYEAELDQAVAGRRIKALCTYSLELCRAGEIVDVVKNHGYALIKRGEWELIENAERRRAEEAALEKAMAQLDEKVRARTRELERANGRLLSEAAERSRVEQQLRRSREQLRSLAGYLQSVREEERTRIARELHDEIGQALTGIKLSLEISAREQASIVRPQLAQALETTNELINRVRNISLELRPAMLDDLGLLPALRWHFERYTGQGKIKVDFKQSGLEGRRFDPGIETAAYRIVQEALTNVARHAGVDRVEVGVSADEKRLAIRIRDAGAGFDPDAVSADSAGLAGMRERTAMLGGELRLESLPGAGALLTAELPLEDKKQR